MTWSSRHHEESAGPLRFLRIDSHELPALSLRLGYAIGTSLRLSRPFLWADSTKPGQLHWAMPAILADKRDTENASQRGTPTPIR
jgi:hypothetical protein